MDRANSSQDHSDFPDLLSNKFPPEIDAIAKNERALTFPIAELGIRYWLRSHLR